MRTVQTLEDTKQLIRILHIEANAIVLHKIDRFPRTLLTSDMDIRRIFFARKLQGIRDEIQICLLYQSRIDLMGRQLVDLNRHIRILIFHIQFFQDFLDQTTQVDILHIQRLASQPRQCE